MKREIITPISEEKIKTLKIGEMVYISGEIYCGRDAVLPKICKMIDEGNIGDINLRGSVIFHTAVSAAGVGPTSSNKVEIEESFAPLSEAGVKIHLGKGSISKKTIEVLGRYNSIFAITPPVTALLNSKTLERKVVSFPELGMEAMHLLKIDRYPIIIAAAHGKSIY